MKKFLTLRKVAMAPAMLLLCGIFLQSCVEEMPILKPLSDTTNSASTGVVSSKSIISLNINGNANTIGNVLPNNILFTSVTGTTLPLFKEYFIVATSNVNQTSNLGYTASFHTDTIGSKKFVFESSQLILNKKTYATFNLSGKAKFTVAQLDDKANTASGTFDYYVYDDILTPKDSIRLTGSFTILK